MINAMNKLLTINIDHHPNDDIYGDLLSWWISKFKVGKVPVIALFAQENQLAYLVKGTLLCRNYLGHEGVFYLQLVPVLRIASQLREIDSDFANCLGQLDTMSF